MRYNASVEHVDYIDQPAADGRSQGPVGDKAQPWRVTMAHGETLAAKRVVFASGGLSFPAVGTDGTCLLYTSPSPRD